MSLIRSLHDDGRVLAESMVKSVFTLAGAKVEFSGAYPGWKPNTDSKIMKTVRDTYQSLFNKVPEIMVIHAGLECGLFKNAYPNWDMVSFGPTIKFPHSPDEKVNVEAVGLYWQLLVEVLKNIPAKA
jgi:dipeptidase D